MKSRIFLSFYSYNSERSSLWIRPPFIAHHSRTRLLGKRNSTTCNLVHWPEWQRANSLLGRWRHIWNRRGRLVTRLNNVMKDMNHLPSKLRTGKFCPGIAFTICTKTTGLPFQVFRCSRKFSVGQTQKVAFYLLSKQILRKLFIGKQPSFSRLKRNPRERSLWCGCPGNCRWRCAYSSESNWTKKIMII